MDNNSGNLEMNGSTTSPNSEIQQVRVPDLERIRNARKRRMMQIKEWQQYDRKMTRESEKMQKKGLAPTGDKAMYRAGPQVNFPQSLIFLEAAARGDLDEVRKLLSNGVCPDVANEDGLTALHQCCIDNTPEMCRLLLRFGANPNARDTERWTPLHAAATCHHTELCAILIAHGADLLAMNADGNMPYECCLPGPTLSLIETEMDKRGITQEELDDLHRLPECEMLADMETLYKSGADLNALDKQGASLLHIAAACGYEEVTIFLLKHGAKIDQLDRDGWQAIHIAACWEHLEVIKILVNFGANLIAETTSGETVFDICDDMEMHDCLMELKEEMERKQFQQQEAHNRREKPKELVRRRSSTNPRSASIRRTSMREKKMISWKEAKQEAEMRGVGGLNLADSELEGAPVPTDQLQPKESIPDRRISSPTSVNTGTSPGVHQLTVRTTSPSTQPGPGKRATSPQSPSNMQPIDVLQSPRSKRQSVNTSNGQAVPAVTDPSSTTSANRASSKITDKNSTKTSRSDKRVAGSEAANQMGSKRGTMDNEHKPNRRSTPENTFTPVPQPRNPANRSTGGSNIDQTLHQISPSPAPKARNHINDRYSNQSSGTLRTSPQGTSSPTPGHRSSSQSRRPRLPDYNASGKNDSPLPNLSVHNAYYNPVQHTQPASSSPMTVVNQSGTLRGNQNKNPRFNHGSTAQDNVTMQIATWPKKPARELIEYDSDNKASGKCCSIM